MTKYRVGDIVQAGGGPELEVLEVKEDSVTLRIFEDGPPLTKSFPWSLTVPPSLTIVRPALAVGDYVVPRGIHHVAPRRVRAVSGGLARLASSRGSEWHRRADLIRVEVEWKDPEPLADHLRKDEVAKTSLITNIDDVRAGDIVTLIDEFGGTYTGPVRESQYGKGLVFGRGAIRVTSTNYRFIHATRPKPELPTDRGAVITDVVTTDGARYSLAVRRYPTAHGMVPWTAISGTDYGNLRDEQIASWKPVKVVPADEA